MGKASSSKKVARAAKAAGRPGAKRSYGWPLTIGAVVLLGVLLIVLTVSSNDDSEPGAPRIGDHWHAAYGIYTCDEFLSPLVDVGPDRSGLHTHDDGLMHIHPFVSRYAGDEANIGNWGETAGLKITDTSFETPNTKRKNGDKCGSKAGHLELVTWDSPADTSPTVLKKGFAAYDPDDDSVWVLAFVADGTEVPLPPSVAALASPADEEPQQQAPPPSSTTAPPADATTTTPAENTPTTAAP